MRWTQQRQARSVFAGRLSVSGHSAQDDRRCSVRQNRVVLTPVAGAKLPVANSIRPDRFSHQAGSDGGKTNSSPGRARHKPSNHCAGNAGVLRLYLYARVRILMHTLHTRPRVQQAPGIPCSLCFGGKEFQQSSGACASRERGFIPMPDAVIASEAKQSMRSSCENGLLRFARNDADRPQRTGNPHAREITVCGCIELEATPPASPISWRSRGGPSARSPGSCADRRC